MNLIWCSKLGTLSLCVLKSENGFIFLSTGNNLLLSLKHSHFSSSLFLIIYLCATIRKVYRKRITTWSMALNLVGSMLELHVIIYIPYPPISPTFQPLILPATGSLFPPITSLFSQFHHFCPNFAIFCLIASGCLLSGWSKDYMFRAQ